MSTVTVNEGDILTANCDVLVNPANGHLRHGGGLARIIEDAATAEPPSAQTGRVSEPIRERVALWRADHATAPLIATGDAYLTSAGMLPFDAVIHAVGPIWGGGGFSEVALLRSAVRRSLLIADQAGYQSIAVPAISAGIFGFPADLCAATLISEAAAFTYRTISLQRIEFWLHPKDEVLIREFSATAASLLDPDGSA